MRPAGIRTFPACTAGFVVIPPLIPFSTTTKTVSSMKKIFFALALLLPVLPGCRRQAESVAEKDFVFSGDEVTILPASPVAEKLVITQLTPSGYEADFRTVGVVRPMEGRLAEVAVPFAGRITRALVHLGDWVRAGQPLFEMSSPEFYEAVRSYYENQVADRNAAASLQRREQMFEAGILSEREIEEARAEAQNARNAYRMSRMALSVYHVDLNRLEMGQPVTVTAPISGRVVACRLTPGQYLKEDADPVATIAELSRVWVSAQVREAQIGRVGQPGTRSEVLLDTAPDSPIEGRIVYVGEILDEETRSAEVMLECVNADRQLRPGMFVPVVFRSPQASALLIPVTAVFQGEQSRYVYVEKGPLHFERRPVRVESAGDGRLCVIAGLSEGERIISDGGIYLSE